MDPGSARAATSCKGYGSGDFDLGLMGSAPAARAASAPLWTRSTSTWSGSTTSSARPSRSSSRTRHRHRGPQGQDDRGALQQHRPLLPAPGARRGRARPDQRREGDQPRAREDARRVAGRQIDAAWVWDPAQTPAARAGGTRILSSADTAKAGLPDLRRRHRGPRFAEANPEFLTQWAKAQDYAVKLINDDPTAAAESVAAVLGISPEQTPEAVRRARVPVRRRPGRPGLPRRQAGHRPASRPPTSCSSRARSRASATSRGLRRPRRRGSSAEASAK